MPQKWLPDPVESAARFSQIPWCKKLLDDPAYTRAPPEFQVPKITTEDAFFGSTLQTPSTVPHTIGLYRTPTSADRPLVDDVRLLLDLQSGMDGYPAISHGGFVAALLDEVMGFLISVNGRELRKRGLTHMTEYYTKYLNTTFKAKLSTPAVVMAYARHQKIDGNKIFIYATVEDGEGKVYATGESLFISPKTKAKI